MPRVLLPALSAVTILMSGCAGRIPVGPGHVLTLEKAPGFMAAGEKGYDTTVQVKWLGSACYYIQLGDHALMTDPFVTHHPMAKVAFSTLASDPVIVEDKTGELPIEPKAIFVGESHYDHLLDLPQIVQQRGWIEPDGKAQPIILGGESTCNILSGYRGTMTFDCRFPRTDGQRVSVSDKLAYHALSAAHAPQIGRHLLFDGRVDAKRNAPPTRADHFPVGETCSYVFKLSGGSDEDPVEFTIYFLGFATEFREDLINDEVGPIDLAIICVPGWKNVRGYPNRLIRALKPRSVLLSHYNDLFGPVKPNRRAVITADLERFIREIEKTLSQEPGIERIFVPAVDTVLHFPARRSN